MTRETWLSSLTPGQSAVEMKSGKPTKVLISQISKGRIWYNDLNGSGTRAVSANKGISVDLSRHLLPPNEDDDVDNPSVIRYVRYIPYRIWKIAND